MASTEDFSQSPEWMGMVAERAIQEAIAEGLFENLPGRGQPLDLSVNPFEPPGMRAVNQLLKKNKVLPPWLLLEQEIEAERALALAALARWEAAEPALREDAAYARHRAAARQTYERHMRATNDLILKLNLATPFSHRAPVAMMVTTRLREFDARYGADT